MFSGFSKDPLIFPLPVDFLSSLVELQPKKKKKKSCCLVAKSLSCVRPFCNLMDHSLPGFSVHGIYWSGLLVNTGVDCRFFLPLKKLFKRILKKMKSNINFDQPNIFIKYDIQSHQMICYVVILLVKIMNRSTNVKQIKMCDTTYRRLEESV